MSVSKYAIKRSFSSYGLWIILGIFLLIPLILIPILKIVYSDLTAQITLLAISGYIGNFFVSYFLGTLISRNINEEIDDGSFLLIISKPLSRMKIWSQKMLIIFIFMICGYILVSFLPALFLIGSDKTELDTIQGLFGIKSFWATFWDQFAIGLIMMTILFGIFSIASLYLNARSLLTWVSVFVVAIIILNTVLSLPNVLGKSLYQLILEKYLYIPIIIVAFGLIGVSFYLFNRKDFAK